ncbi:hypothetical protein C5L28_002368 [Lentilactobacillus parakefiri]|uniref:Addiction module toxin, PemK-like protein n=2 Tax=Lentilactobacillus parakefiri TaxID=152332 RepID=A0A224V7V8_9LACO|nr:hypothetical protein C5L28_002368 [Lentilactobacillus parakefiri]GAW73166.1 hypothetical protein LPKJCM_02303 [Lentilactobacillus parakefiri]
MIQMRTNDLISLYVSFVETNGGKSRPVLIRKVSEQTVEAFKITSKYRNKSAYIKQQYYPIKDWKAAGLKKPSWVDLGNLYRFPKAGLNFKEIGHLSQIDQNKISDFALDLKFKRRGKGQKNIQQHFGKNKRQKEFTQRIQNQLKTFSDKNPEVKPKNNSENKNDRPSY